MLSTLVIAVIMVVMLFIKLGMKDSKNMAANEAGGFSTFVDQIIKQGNFIVVLWIMSIPEGLPVTIGISLAFSVMKMYNDKLLVRNLDAPEKMGTVQEVVCSKTGTITQNQMRVHSFYSEGKLVKNSRKNTLDKCEVSDEAKMKLRQGILNNCSAIIEMDDKDYVPVGNGTEVGLLRFL